MSRTLTKSVPSASASLGASACLGLPLSTSSSSSMFSTPTKQCVASSPLSSSSPIGSSFPASPVRCVRSPPTIAFLNVVEGGGGGGEDYHLVTATGSSFPLSSSTSHICTSAPYPTRDSSSSRMFTISQKRSVPLLALNFVSPQKAENELDERGSRGASNVATVQPTHGGCVRTCSFSSSSSVSALRRSAHGRASEHLAGHLGVGAVGRGGVSSSSVTTTTSCRHMTSTGSNSGAGAETSPSTKRKSAKRPKTAAQEKQEIRSTKEMFDRVAAITASGNNTASLLPEDYADIKGYFINPFGNHKAQRISKELPLLAAMGFALDRLPSTPMSAAQVMEARRKGEFKVREELDEDGNPLVDTSEPRLIIADEERLRKFASDFRGLATPTHVQAYSVKAYWRSLYRAFDERVVDPVEFCRRLIARHDLMLSDRMASAFGISVAKDLSNNPPVEEVDAHGKKSVAGGGGLVTHPDPPRFRGYSHYDAKAKLSELVKKPTRKNKNKRTNDDIPAAATDPSSTMSEAQYVAQLGLGLPSGNRKRNAASPEEPAAEEEDDDSFDSVRGTPDAVPVVAEEIKKADVKRVDKLISELSSANLPAQLFMPSPYTSLVSLNSLKVPTARMGADMGDGGNGVDASAEERGSESNVEMHGLCNSRQSEGTVSCPSIVPTTSPTSTAATTATLPHSAHETTNEEEEVSITNDSVATAAAATTPSPSTRVTLNQEQLKVIELATKGYNLYIGGFAGTGKTQLLRALRQVLQHRLGLSVGVVATTGVAARNLGGTTFHSHFRIAEDETMLDRSEILQHDVVIVDEVSMLTETALSILDAHMRIRAGHSPLPFAGVQIILCGDFLQLPCVKTQGIRHMDLFRDNFIMCGLKTVVRQNSTEFIEQLQAWRRGRIPAGFLEARSTTTLPDREGKEDTAAAPMASAEDATTQTKVESSGSSPSSSSSSSLPDQQNSLVPSTTSRATNATAVTDLDWRLRPWDLVAPGTIFLTPTLNRARHINEHNMALLGGESYALRSILDPPTLFMPEVWTDHYLLHVGERFLRTDFKRWVYEYVSDNVEGVQWEDICVYQLKGHTYAMRCRVPRVYVDAEESKERLVNVLHRLPTALAAYIRENPVDRKYMTRDSARVNITLCKELVDRDGILVKATRDFAEDYEPQPEDHPLYCHFVGTGPADGPYCPAIVESRLMRNAETQFPNDSFKVGAQVMLDTNISKTLVNGLVGTIVAMLPLTTEVIAMAPKFRQATVVKYVEDHLSITGGMLPYVPVVDFGPTDPRTIVFPHSRPIRSSSDSWVVPVLRIPIRPAYAFTIHKIQGLTLSAKVHVDLFDAWPCKHLLYVAFSRVREADQLSISGFRPKFITVDKSAVLFDESLPAPDEAEKFTPTTAMPAMWKRFPNLRNARRERLNKQKREARKQKVMERLLSLREALKKGTMHKGPSVVGGRPFGFISDALQHGVDHITAVGKRPMSAEVLRSHAVARGLAVGSVEQDEAALAAEFDFDADPRGFLSKARAARESPDMAEGEAVRAALQDERKTSAATSSNISSKRSALHSYLVDTDAANDDFLLELDGIRASSKTNNASSSGSKASGEGADERERVPKREEERGKNKMSFSEKLRLMKGDDDTIGEKKSQPRIDIKSLFALKDKPVVITHPNQSLPTSKLTTTTAAIAGGNGVQQAAKKSTSAFSSLPIGGGSSNKEDEESLLASYEEDPFLFSSLSPALSSSSATRSAEQFVSLLSPEEEESMMSPYALLDAEGDELYTDKNKSYKEGSASASSASNADDDDSLTEKSASPTDKLLHASLLGGVGAEERGKGGMRKKE